MEVGDLIIVTELFPSWHWLNYTTGHIGMVMKKRSYHAGHILLDVFFLHNQEIHPVPLDFVRPLRESK